ncbi:n-acetylglutamate synthase [Tamlana sp. 2201CG12-4]|uniref:n-acetylglutamate synthase n=1 Tax=Tamlana sp. 2201CG12-4 TaxID=3112582 RepID=UPI002DB71FF1|nr:n-acetylglutamate synthase [Tamlana sp. 2201CG12-4]MEC3906390.1 n-acetylglutamate synthase [Tamlana sp. 2201CG12-4]
MINYNNKRFKPISSSENSETTSDTIFVYKQKGNILTATYQGDHIIEGHLIGVVDNQGNIDMRYHQINSSGELMTGICISKPKIDTNGKIKLYERWEWTSGDKSNGTSVLQEI